MANINLPRNVEIANTVVEAESAQQHKRMDRGLLGAIVGYGSEKSGNVAGFIAISTFLAVICIMLWGQDTSNFSRKDQVLILIPLLTSALGYMFGERSKSDG